MKTLNSIGLFGIFFSQIIMASQPITNYLLKPTGQYNVAFKEIHWVNNTICPHPNFSNQFTNQNHAMIKKITN